MWGDDVQLSFGEYALDVDRRELTRGSELILLSDRMSSTCWSTLWKTASMWSARTTSLESVWGGRIVSELTLTSRINAVRKAVGDSGEEQRLIRTIARKGFRFVGEVTNGRSSDGSYGTTSASYIQ